MLDGTSVHETQTPCKNDIKPGSMGLLLNSTRHKHLLHSPPLPWRYIFRTVALSDLQKKQTLGKCSERLHELITSCMCHISQTSRPKVPTPCAKPESHHRPYCQLNRKSLPRMIVDRLPVYISRRLCFVKYYLFCRFYMEWITYEWMKVQSLHLKCVRKPTRSRLSLTHYANKSSRWAE